MLLFLLTLACGEKELEDTAAEETETTDTAEESDSGAEGEDTGSDTAE
jgi:hypothetical protein